MIESKKYDERFFHEMEKGSLASAERVLPVINELIRPQSVIDVGCGTGVWLYVWEKRFNIRNYLGLEGPYVKKEMVKIPPDKLMFKDLKEPLGISQKFDLVMSLEVAEHLPEEKAAAFVYELVLLGDVIMFSAAIPGQGGTYHINEQYPEYWAQKFKKHGYVPVDCVRPKIWNDDGVEFWYRQNILLFVKEAALSDYPSLQPYFAATFPDCLSRIHPFLFDALNHHLKRISSVFGFLNWKWYVFKTRYLKRK